MVQISTVWDRTTAFASAAVAAIMPIALILLFLPVSIQLAIAPLLIKQAVGTRLIVMVLFWLVELLGTLSLIVLALGATLHPGEAVRAALARLGPAVAIFILFFIAMLVLCIPLGVVVAAAGMNMAELQAGNPVGAGSLSAVGAWFLLLYGLALLVFCFWIAARLLVIEPVILAERRGIGAITRTFALTKGLALRLVGVLILYAIVATIAVLAAKMVFGSIFALIAPNDGEIGLATVLTSIVVAAVSTAFKVIAAIFVAKLYQAIGDAHERAAEPA
ncbi:MAG: hypothetical protein ACTHM0_13985 [Sphingomonas sp.]